MQPRSQRRVHSAEFKAQFLAECQAPGASVAAIALAHGLNVNLLRKWLVDRSIKRAGLAAPRTVAPMPAAVTPPPTAAALQFIPCCIRHASTGTTPYTYLPDVLERLPTQPASRIAERFPHQWHTP